MKHTKNPLKTYLCENNISVYKLVKDIGRKNYESTIYRFVETQDPSDLYKRDIFLLRLIHNKTGVDLIKWIVDDADSKINNQ